MAPLGSAGTDNAAGEVDADDTLENLIAQSGGDTSHNYLVVKDGEPVGLLDMKDLVRALVPRAASEQGIRGQTTAA